MGYRTAKRTRVREGDEIMTTRIRRWVETDTGHRVPNHKSKCCHMHGHRYRWEAEIEGDVVDVAGVSDEGMLIDFSDVSAILNEHVHDLSLIHI